MKLKVTEERISLLQQFTVNYLVREFHFRAKEAGMDSISKETLLKAVEKYLEDLQLDAYADKPRHLQETFSEQTTAFIFSEASKEGIDL